MSFTMEDFKRQLIKDNFKNLTREERQEALQSLPPEKRREMLDSLPAEERLAGMPPEQRLAGMPPEQIEQYLKRLTSSHSPGPRKPRRKK